MIEIAVGSKNPTKLRAVQLAYDETLNQEFSVNGYQVDSGVADQPMSDEEMILGARNRAHQAIVAAPMGVRFAVGMEGGIRGTTAGWFDLGWVCIIDWTGGIGYGMTPAIHVPNRVREIMESSGKELSDAVSAVYNTNTTTDRDCSAVITNGLLPADLLYKLGVLAAFSDVYSHLSSREKFERDTS